MPEEQNSEKVEMKTPASFTEKHHAHLGPILGVLILLLVLILGGLFLWGGMLVKEMPEPERVIINNEPETPRVVADAQILETLSPSDELDAIEADLNSTNLDSIDADMTTIEAELGAALPE